MPKQIIITVALDGSVIVQTKGYKGSACKDASKLIEEALGARQSDTLTPEYHQRGETGTKATQGA